MPENWIALAGAFVAGLLIGWIFTRGGGSKDAAPAPAPTTRAASPAADAAVSADGAEDRRAIRADLASLRRRLASVEAALRDVRRGV